MKKISQWLVVILTLFFSVSLFAEDYTFDPNHTYVLWHANHFGFSELSGKWLASGTLKIDEKNPENSQVNVTIKVAGLSTAIKELDNHLKGILFFNVKKYPDATFVSDKVTVTGDNTAKVHGTLTVHGVSKPITLDIKLNKKGMNLITEKETLGFSGKTSLKRSDFGIKTLVPEVGDDITIEIEAEAGKSKML